MPQQTPDRKSLSPEFSAAANGTALSFETGARVSGGKEEGGLRRRGILKNDLPDKPLLTVITVVFNGRESIENTILSVLNQSYDNVEYIIVDGGSTDGTVEIIKKYDGAIDYWLSEQDAGIYDAMNKGIDLATGSWVNFMNSGDSFYLADTVKRCSSFMQQGDAVFLYGDMASDYGSFVRCQKAKALEHFWRGMRFSHQSVFVKLSYHRERKYNQSFSIAADFDFFLRGYLSGAPFKYLGETVSVASVQGLSDSNRCEVLRQYRQAVRRLCPSLRRECYFLYAQLDAALRSVAKCLLPELLVSQIKKIK